jgi:hypothetical protein
MRISLLLLGAVLLTFSACERKIVKANLDAVKPDMTSKEVESILGAPTHVETGPELVSSEPKTLLVTRHIYQQGNRKIELRFVGDRLATGSVNGVPAVTGSLGR